MLKVPDLLLFLFKRLRRPYMLDRDTIASRIGTMSTSHLNTTTTSLTGMPLANLKPDLRLSTNVGSEHENLDCNFARRRSSQKF